MLLVVVKPRVPRYVEIHYPVFDVKSIGVVGYGACLIFGPKTTNAFLSLPLLDFRIALIPCQTRNYGTANLAVKRR